MLSLQFMVICALIIALGYFGGRWIMTRVMYFQEKSSMDQKVRAASQIEYPDELTGTDEPGMMSDETDE